MYRRNNRQAEQPTSRNNRQAETTDKKNNRQAERTDKQKNRQAEQPTSRTTDKQNNRQAEQCILLRMYVSNTTTNLFADLSLFLTNLEHTLLIVFSILVYEK